MIIRSMKFRLSSIEILSFFLTPKLVNIESSCKMSSRYGSLISRLTSTDILMSFIFQLNFALTCESGIFSENEIMI